MKRIYAVILALFCLGLFSNPQVAIAALIYVDAIDGSYHPGSASPNTFNATNNSATDWVTTTSSGDIGTPAWGYRNTGPGLLCFGTSCYQGKFSQNDQVIYTKVTGLVPGNSYSGLRLYFGITAGNTLWRIQYSFDGVNWSSSIHRDTPGVVSLIDSTSDALGTATTTLSGDTRCYYPIPGSVTADGAGAFKLYIRCPSDATDRTLYDGLAYDSGAGPQATSPQPSNGGKLFGTNVLATLSWVKPAPVGTVTCNIYFGNQSVYNPSNANHFGLPLIQSGVAGQSIAMPSLTIGNKYYWIVDCVDSVAGLRAGALWSFDVVSPSAATGIVISEFMAANDSGLTNSFGQAGDWIELYNNSASTVYLAGWYLTDNAANLTKWKFPSGTMPPDSYLLVWADDINAVTNGEIHTSFKLTASGEYLGLVRPDGVTIEHDYAPVFPNQDDDISYGVDLLSNGSEVDLIPAQAGCRVLVPTSDIGTNWHLRVYNDTTWLAGATGVGYETTGVEYEENINTDVQTGMYNQMPSVYLRIPFQVDDPALFSALKIHMLFEDGFVAYINGVEVARSNAPVTPAWNASATASRSQSIALISTTFNVAQNLSTLLVSGTNILAIHAMNQTSSATTFLVQPTLEGTLANGVVLEQKRYYSVPTPGAANTNAFLGFVADTKFSVDRGFYSGPFSVAITCNTPGAAIRYTLDGTAPSEVSGNLYTGPINISTTSKLRAVAYKTGLRSSNVDTHTYIFAENVLNQPAAPAGWPTAWTGNVTFDAGITWSDYQMDTEVIGAPHNLANAVRSALTNIPTISLVTDLSNLFDPNTGVYVNPRESGVTWERPVSAEMIYPDGREGFQINCGLRIQGNGSRGPASTPKHSLRLLFKGIYGPTKLDHPLFTGSPVESFDSIHLRAVYNNAWTKLQSDQRARAQETSDQFARDLQLAIGQKSIYGDVCHLYINGLYWGVYHHGERPDAGWAASHFGGDKEEWDAINAGVAVDGDTVAWTDLWNRANAGLTNFANYTNFAALCDMVNFSDYMLIMHYVDIQDWDSKNNYQVRRRLPGEKFKFIAWDSERALENPTGNSAFTVNNASRPSGLFQRVKVNSEFQLLFADRIHKHLFNDGAMTPTRATNIWRQRSDVIDTVIAAESARWGDFRRDVIPNAPNVIYTPAAHYFPYQSQLFSSFFPGRTAHMINFYISQGLYPSLAAPEFNQHGGNFTNSRTVTITGPAPIYYTLDGSDPRQYGTGAIVGTNYTGAITLNHSTRVKARCYNGTNWSALLEADFFDVMPSPLRVTEVMYAPRPPAGAELVASTNDSAFSFVEIQNTSAETVGLVGVTLQGGIQFDFSKTTNLTLAAGDYAVVVENPTAFAARYPAVPAAKVRGEFFGDLATDGDSIQLAVQGLGNVVAFEYSDGRGWPLPADGAGHSLIPLVTGDQSAGQLSYGGNWKASVNVHGSPAAPEPPAAFCIALNEIAAHTDYNNPSYPGYDSNDWIELMNCSGSTLSLNGFYLSDDPDNLKKWAIPSGTNLAAGQRIVFDEVTGFHSPLTNGFGIDKLGEQILLSYASGGGPASVVDYVQFKGQENGRTLGRYPDASGAWVTCLPTPGNVNVRAPQEPVISEIMYHPPDIFPGVTNTAHEFVELYNPTAAPVNLWVLDGGTNLGSWRVTGQAEYTFPANTVLAASTRVLIVPFDPVTNLTAKASFVAQYGMTGSEIFYGPFSGTLDNAGGRVALERPIGPDLPGESSGWVIVDEVYYSPTQPWPVAANGSGQSLHRINLADAGRDPSSWSADDASPGSGNITHPDMIVSISAVSGQLKLGFNLLPGFSYVIERKTNSFANPWTPYANVVYPATEQTITNSGSVSPAYFRLRRNP